MEATTTPALRFADAARRISAAARAVDLTVPAFRSPPRVDGAARTIRRYPGGAVVSVQLRGRSFAEVAADMIEGVLVANGVEGEARVHLRTSIHEALTPTDGRRAAA